LDSTDLCNGKVGPMWASRGAMPPDSPSVSATASGTLNPNAVTNFRFFTVVVLGRGRGATAHTFCPALPPPVFPPTTYYCDGRHTVHLALGGPAPQIFLARSSATGSSSQKPLPKTQWLLSAETNTKRQKWFTAENENGQNH